MERYLDDHFLPKLEAMERRMSKAEMHIAELATKFSMPPKIDFEIIGTDAEATIDNARKIYEAFGARTNFNLKVRLTEGETNVEGDGHVI